MEYINLKKYESDSEEIETSDEEKGKTRNKIAELLNIEENKE